MISIKYVPFYADDVNQQANFFIEKLGFKKLESTRLFAGGECRLVSTPDTKVIIAISDNIDYLDFNMPMILNTDDCLKTFHRLRDAGLTFSKEPHYLAAGLVAEFTDANSNRFILLEERNYNEDL
jgi:predicted enzyme related to lactoylglutathione lyase